MGDLIKNAYQVDVIIPVFNGEGYILRAIRSVMNQTIPPAKIIVVDDFSQDNTVELVENIIQESHSRITLIKLKENHGPSFARNIGFDSAKSDFVIFLDSDDELYSSAIENLLNSYDQYLQKHVGLVYGRAEFYDENMQGIDSLRTKSQLFMPVAIGKTNLPNLLSNVTDISIGCFMINSEVFRAVGKFDVDLNINEDWDLYLRVAQAGYSFELCDHLLARINSHNNNTTKNISKNYYGMIQFINRWIAVIKDCDLRRRNYSDALCYSILKELPNLKPYFYLRFYFPHASLKVIFGKYPMSLEIEILRKAYSFVSHKLSNNG